MSENVQEKEVNDCRREQEVNGCIGERGEEGEA